jgi:NADP-dependent 3-hydroxy acid dehydrogenase YdfG
MIAKTACITGATAGIGRACVRRFIAGGWRVIAIGRRASRLLELKKNYSEKELHTAQLDVRDRKKVRDFFDNLLMEWSKIDLLINNAGLARGLNLIDEGDFEDWDEMIDVNLRGLLNVTRMVAPMMTRHNAGHIINVGSLAGKEVYARGNVYCATKHAVDALTRAMRLDLTPRGVKVSAIHPGLAETEFSVVRFRGDETRAKKVYEGFRPLTGEDVAETIFYMANAPAHVNLADVVILPAAQAASGVVARELTPQKF